MTPPIIQFKFWFLIICCILQQNTNAQNKIKFTHLTNLDGLSQSTVQAILKDKFGFIWFGTQDGLNRYDGYSFKVYRHQPKDSTSLRKSHIVCLYEDSQSNLWVGTANGGLSLYDRKNDRFIHYKEKIGETEGLSQKTVTAILEDSDKNIWIGTYWKLNLLDRVTGKVTYFGNDPNDPSSISNDGITCIFEDNRKNLWVGTSNGLNVLDRKTNKFRRLLHSPDPNSISSNTISSIYQDSLNNLWIGTNGGLNRFDYATGMFKRYLHEENNIFSLGDNEITAITDAGNGKLWIGTNSLLDLFDPKTNQFNHFNSDPNISTTLSKNANITSIFRKDGILWVGTYQGGINKYDEHLNFYDLYKNNPTDYESLSFNIVTGLAEAPNGNIWIATGGGALNLWNRQTNKFLRFNPDPSNKDAIASYGLLNIYQGKKNNYLWIGTYGNCIDRYDPATNKFKHYSKGESANQLNNDAVYAIMEDSKGNIWMGTNGGGVNVLNQETGEITKYVNDPNNINSVGGNYIRCFYEDGKGNIWIGSTGGVSIYEPSLKSFSHYNQNNTSMESDVIYAFHQDKAGNMWIGTLGGGLNKLNLSTKNIKTYTSYEGLPDNTINSIIEDRLGFLWISTNNGLSRFDPAKETFKNSSLENGIQSYEFSQGAGLITQKGEILLGGINGFNLINPEELQQNLIPPPVVLTDFKIFNKSVSIGNNSPLKENIVETREIELSYNDYIITFEFAALGYTAPDKNEYAYMLEGFDKDWIYSGSKRIATYTNLNPGTYELKIKAANNDGLWNENYSSVRIIITPPFWETWWFRMVLILVIVSSLILIYKSRIRNIKKQKLALEKQVRERTDSLSKMTQEEIKSRRLAHEANKELEHKNKELEQFAYVASHDLQEPLRTISSFASLLQKQYHEKLDEKSDRYLEFIMHSSDRMKVLINDLLEYSRLGRKKELAIVDCNIMLNEISEDLAAAISESNTIFQIQQLPVINAYPTELKQVFQNLIVNAIKFRKKDKNPLIVVSAKQDNNFWHFTVQDNGIGIDPKHSERIFNIFQRLHTRNEYPGSGIGLSNCRKIVELHKGKIWVESVPGEGSNFQFTIPVNNNR